MSSSYAVICASHDPAIMVTGPFEWNHPSEALAAVTDRTGDLAAHRTCDLLITRTSGALIEICCPPPGAPHTGMHNKPQWVQVEWLRLMIAAMKTHCPPGKNDLGEALDQFHRCWNRARVWRLRGILDPAGTGDDL